MIMDLEETEDRNDSAVEDHQQFNWPAELVHSRLGGHGVVSKGWQPVGNGVSTEAEGTEHLVRAVVNYGVCELTIALQSNIWNYQSKPLNTWQ
jgi:hypothetical protein